MKRLIISLIAVVGLLAITATPASATTLGRVCKTRWSPNGDFYTQVCADMDYNSLTGYLQGRGRWTKSTSGAPGVQIGIRYVRLFRNGVVVENTGYQGYYAFPTSPNWWDIGTAYHGVSGGEPVWYAVFSYTILWPNGSELSTSVTSDSWTCGGC